MDEKVIQITNSQRTIINLSLYGKDLSCNQLNKSKNMHVRLKSYTCVALIFISFPVISQNLYVSSKGTNIGAGSIVAPFATLQRALDEVKSIKSNEDNKVDTIFLREGVHHIPHTLYLDTAYSNLVIQAFQGEIDNRHIKQYILRYVNRIRECF